MVSTRTWTGLGIAVVLGCAVPVVAIDRFAEERKYPYTPTEANLRARRWFRSARFGMFIHWGVYSLLGKGEWVMHRDKMTIEQYEKLPPRFNPTAFDPEAWVRLAKHAGMKYITFTSKHHDGFAMFDSKVSDYDVVDRTPYGKDVVKMLADACHKHGLKLFLYYSHLDWHHPDYYPLGRTGAYSGRPPGGDWYRYLDYLDAQVRELCTQYGPIGGIWFDGWWDRMKFPETDWRLHKTYKMIHDLQPQALIGNNHHVDPFPGEDIQTWEKGLPGHKTAGVDEVIGISDLPSETCETIGRSWGYKADEKNFKSVRELVGLLVRAACHDANFLLNVGPDPDGTIRPEFVKRLEGIGAWMARYGSTIYDTRGGPFPVRPWGGSTHRGTRIFLHVLDWSYPELALPPVDRTVVRAATFDTNEPVRFQQSDLGILLELPPRAAETLDQIIILETKPLPEAETQSAGNS